MSPFTIVLPSAERVIINVYIMLIYFSCFPARKHIYKLVKLSASTTGTARVFVTSLCKCLLHYLPVLCSCVAVILPINFIILILIKLSKTK